MADKKFIYGKGEIEITKCQCELCKYNNPENINVCIKYPKGKKQEILNGEIFCSKLQIKNIVNLDIQTNQ